ncbi:MAG TPA: hypothetical protein VF450_01950 [Noviherbaspirillum sp.]
MKRAGIGICALKSLLLYGFSPLENQERKMKRPPIWAMALRFVALFCNIYSSAREVNDV